MYKFTGMLGNYEQQASFYGVDLEDAKRKAVEWFGHDRIEFVEYIKVQN